MRTMTMAVLALALALPGAAQQSRAADATPALIHDFSERSDDSELVRAAKRALALRRTGGIRSSGWVLTDAMVRHVVVTGTPRAPQQAAGEVPASTSAASTPAVDRPAVEKKLQDAKQELARMAAESDELYGGDVDEDKVAQRLGQLPGEIDSLNKQLQQPQPQPPARPPQ